MRTSMEHVFAQIRSEARGRRHLPALAWFLIAAMALAVGARAGAQHALILQDQMPWGYTYWYDALDALGVPYTELGSADVPTLTMADYDLIIVPSQQVGSFNTVIEAHVSDFEDYVELDGGKLILMLSTWTQYVPYIETLPLGAIGHHDYYVEVYANANPTHPVMAGVPDTGPGSYASHGKITDHGSVEVLSTVSNQTTSYLVEAGAGMAYIAYLIIDYPWNTDFVPIGENVIEYLLWGTCQVTDFDGDGYDSLACGGDDCDDADPDQFPGADEYCNGEDDDCDGDVDEGDALDPATWYLDADADGFGDPGVTVVDCDQPADHVPAAGDCDDSDPDQYPGADEYCNGEDDDCDGAVDEDDALDALVWYTDADGDGHGDAGAPATACAAPPGYAGSDDDCDDGDPGVFPGADEYCNGVDDDCDGVIDEADALDVQTWYQDADGDGFGDPAVSVVSCYAPLDYVGDAGDCDDGAADVNPAEEEICNGVDDDCDPATDETADADVDGFSICDGDCDESDADAFPGNDEVCDGIDNDCDGQTGADEADDDGDGWMGCAGDCDDGIDNDCDTLVDGADDGCAGPDDDDDDSADDDGPPEDDDIPDCHCVNAIAGAGRPASPYLAAVAVLVLAARRVRARNC